MGRVNKREKERKGEEKQELLEKKRLREVIEGEIEEELGS
jgi:hypothetical protein